MTSVLKAALLGIVIFCVTILLFLPVTIFFSGKGDYVASPVKLVEKRSGNIRTYYTIPLDEEQYPQENVYKDPYCPENCENCRHTMFQNGICDETLNNEACEFDGGDCEIVFCDLSVNDCLSNPLYQEGLIGEFSEFLIKVIIYITSFKDCEINAKPCSGVKWENCSTIGDNICDKDSSFNCEECGFDGGDCQPNICFSTSDHNHCIVPNNIKCDWYKDGDCDAAFNNSKCCFDGGDCEVAGSNTELCDLTVNDGQCPITFEDCVDNPAYDLGLLSCEELDSCFIPPWTSCSRIGDGSCDQSLNTKECYFDGGDCQPKICIEAGIKCIVESGLSCEYGPGDGLCDDELNTEECNFDHGDCFEYTGCPENCDYGLLDDNVGCSFIGNGLCDERFNVESCNYDGGDCMQCPENCNYPEFKGCWEIGNGFCNAVLNVSSCYFDGGDCKEDEFTMVISMKDRY